LLFITNHPEGSAMNEVIAVNYNPYLLALSFAVAVLGSFVGLLACRRIAGADGRISKYNAISAAIAIGGVGVWAMHFIGMLALKVDLAMGYAAVETLVSIFAAILATALALAFVAMEPNSPARLVTAGIAMGLGICVMHYLGMYGMRFNGVFAWNAVLVALSVAIAIVASTAALWLAFRANGMGMRVLAALVMAVAVCAMHYTGVAAADIICTTTNRLAMPTGFAIVPASRLLFVVTFVAATLILFMLIDQLRTSIDKPRTARNV
jgi:NO-binding membrane sensor protein with MHYT domain